MHYWNIRSNSSEMLVCKIRRVSIQSRQKSEISFQISGKNQENPKWNFRDNLEILMLNCHLDYNRTFCLLKHVRDPLQRRRMKEVDQLSNCLYDALQPKSVHQSTWGVDKLILAKSYNHRGQSVERLDAGEVTMEESRQTKLFKLQLWGSRSRRA